MSGEATIAALALGISLWNLWLWYQGSQPKLEVVAKNGVLTHRPGGYMILTVRNKRPFNTQVVALTMPIPGTTETMYFPHADGQMAIPCTLHGFHSTLFWIPLYAIADVLKENGLSGEADVVFHVEAGSGHKFAGNSGLLIDAWAGKKPTYSPD